MRGVVAGRLGGRVCSCSVALLFAPSHALEGLQRPAAGAAVPGQHVHVDHAVPRLTRPSVEALLPTPAQPLMGSPA
eukprot:263563-Chlamydomonas_euryale.AAC.1